MKLGSCIISFVVSVAALPTPTAAFLCPCGTQRPRGESGRWTTLTRGASEVSGDESCPGYPRCSGEYRDKGCDGAGRIAGGVGALLPWLPIKAYRPCPAFVEAKYKYSRQGQSLDEVVFARRETPLTDMTLEGGKGSEEPDAGDASKTDVVGSAIEGRED